MKKIKREYFFDVIYSIGGVVLLNSVVQFIMYPYLTRQMGENAFGSVLSIISLILIVSSTFGGAASYSRILADTKNEGGNLNEYNGDYVRFIFGSLIISFFILLGSQFLIQRLSITEFIFVFLLMSTSVFRYYADVDFKIVKNFKFYFLLNSVITIGYLIGVIIYRLLSSWAITILVGEIFGVLFVVVNGHIFKRPLFTKSHDFVANLKSYIFLIGTNLINAIIINVDRILILMVYGGELVTVFYAATLFGKIVAMIANPCEGVILGYLTGYKGKISAKIFSFICMGGVLGGFLLNGICFIASDLLIRVMYPGVYEQARTIFIIANAGQIIFFIANLLTVILLRFTNEKYQLWINIAYLILYFLLTVPALICGGVFGFAIAILAINMLKIIAVWLVGVNCFKNN